MISCGSIKLGVIEDHSNRTRLAKLLRFFSSNSETEQTSLQDYVERMKEKQENIFFMAGTSREEVENSPFVESLLKKGYEVGALRIRTESWGQFDWTVNFGSSLHQPETD